MSEMAHKEIVELLPAYALGILDAEEAQAVAQHLATCQDCRAELAAYEETAAALPLAGPLLTPSPDLEKRLMERVAPAGGQQVVDARPSLSWWRRLAQALQTMPRWQPVALLLLVVLAIANIMLWQRANRGPDVPGQAIILSGTEAAPQARGTLLISENGRHATLVVEDLPPLSAERQYQLWLVQDGQRASGGVFSVGDDGYSSFPVSAAQPLDAYSAFGVTIEPAGGSPGPTGEQVLGSS